MIEIYGPCNLLMYDPSGLLLEDYENIPVLELGCNPPYCRELFKDYEFKKTRDWDAYLLSPEKSFPDLFRKFHRQIARKAAEGYDGLVIRNLELKNVKTYRRDCACVRQIVNKTPAIPIAVALSIILNQAFSGA